MTTSRIASRRHNGCVHCLLNFALVAGTKQRWAERISRSAATAPEVEEIALAHECRAGRDLRKRTSRDARHRLRESSIGNERVRVRGEPRSPRREPISDLLRSRGTRTSFAGK